MILLVTFALKIVTKTNLIFFSTFLNKNIFFMNESCDKTQKRSSIKYEL